VLEPPEVHLILFRRGQLVGVKPPDLCACRAGQGLVLFYRMTLTNPLNREEGWKHRTTLDGRVPATSGEL
jgi:hypothetical protein